jgi:hypothetical protein
MISGYHVGMFYLSSVMASVVFGYWLSPHAAVWLMLLLHTQFVLFTGILEAIQKDRHE